MRARRTKITLIVVAAVIGGLGLMVGLGFAFLYAVNPVGDEWVCSQGEAPAGSACYPTEGPLPSGLSWDPLGNRPMSYNCDKRGWTLIEGPGTDDRDCLNKHLGVPPGWHQVD